MGKKRPSFNGGNSHQRKMFDRAVERVMQRKAATEDLPADSADRSETQPKKHSTLQRPSIEAYVFFIFGGGSATLNFFGISINFLAGTILSLAVAACGVDLLWRSPWTSIWNRASKYGGTVIVVIGTLLLINQGYLLTHHRRLNDNRMASAIENLAGVITGLKQTIENQLQRPVSAPTDPFMFWGEDDTETGKPLTHLKTIINGSLFLASRERYKIAVVAYHLTRGSDILDVTDIQKSEVHDIDDEPIILFIPLNQSFLETVRHGVVHTNYTLLLVPNGANMQWDTIRAAQTAGSIVVMTHGGSP